MSEFNVWKIRQEFPMLHRTMHGKPFIYLDTAATSHKPRCVIDSLFIRKNMQLFTVLCMILQAKRPRNTMRCAGR